MNPTDPSPTPSFASLEDGPRSGEGQLLDTILTRLDAAYDYSGWHWQAKARPLVSF